MKNILRSIKMIAGIGLIALLSSGCGDGTTEYTESSNTNYSETGKVISKEHHDKNYLNPMDNLNPMKDIDPSFDFKKFRFATMTPEKNEIKFSYSKGTAVVDDRNLFAQVETNSSVKIEFTEIYDVKKDSQGHILERTLSSYKVIKVLPLK